MNLPVAATQYVQVPVILDSPTGPGDPSIYTVDLAFPARGTGADSATWHSGSWSMNQNGVHLAQLLVGTSGTFVPSAGEYDIYVRVNASPEQPILYGGVLIVT